MGIFGAFFLTAAASTASSFLLCSLFPFLSWVHEMLVLLSTWPSPDKPKRSSKKKSAKRSGIFGFLLPSLTNGLFLSLVFQICICKAEVSFSLCFLLPKFVFLCWTQMLSTQGSLPRQEK